MRSIASSAPALLAGIAVATAMFAGAPAGLAQQAPRAQPAPSDLRRAGAAALEGGQLREALALYQRALAAGDDARVWFDLCLVRYAAGDYGRAINACYRALPANEDRAITLLAQIAAAMAAAREAADDPPEAARRA